MTNYIDKSKSGLQIFLKEICKYDENCEIQLRKLLSNNHQIKERIKVMFARIDKNSNEYYKDTKEIKRLITDYLDKKSYVIIQCKKCYKATLTKEIELSKVNCYSCSEPLASNNSYLLESDIEPKKCIHCGKPIIITGHSTCNKCYNPNYLTSYPFG